MRICILKESLCIGGTERSAANTSKILDDNNDVYVALFNGGDIDYDYAGTLVDFKLPPKSGVVGKIYNTYLRHRQIKKLLREKKIDILFQFVSISNLITRIKYKNTVKIISARDFGGMLDKTSMFKSGVDSSDAMICNSEYIKNYYLSKYPEDSEKVFTVYNVIDTDEICKQSKEQTEKEFTDFISCHKQNFVSVGRFCKEKGFEHLLSAFSKVHENKSDCGLILIGDGDYKEKYNEIINQHNLQDCVYFTGFQNNPYKYMAKCDVFVLSSLSEGFPNVLAEAMSLGLPAVAANCYSGPAEILRDDSDYNAVTDSFAECDYGIITPRITQTDNQIAISSLSDALLHLINNDTLMKKYSELSKHRAAEFSPKAAAEKFDAIFEKLCNGSKK